MRTSTVFATLLGVVVWGLACPNAHAAFGRTEGTFGVSAEGAATYTIPIWIPPGPQGIAPSLALSYNSLRGNGALGVGWSLTGLAAIERCPRTSPIDDTSGAVSLTSADRYCLGSNRLRLVSGVYGAANSTYRFEVDDFSVVTASSTLQGSGPQSFTVVGKNGLTYEYGVTANARVALGVSQTVLRWLLNKVRDRNGNSYTVEYSVSDGVEVPTTLRWSPTSANGSTYRYSAVLNYEDKTNPKDWGAWFIAGHQALSKKRLSSISIQYQAATVRKYELTYDAAPLTAFSRLTTVEECSDDAGANCLLPTTMSYQSGRAPSNTSASVNVIIGGLLVGSADFNGDGKDDLVRTIGANWYVLFGANGGFGQPVQVQDLTGGFGTTVDYDLFLPGRRAAFIANIGGTLYTFSADDAGTEFSRVSTGIAFPAGTVPTGVRGRDGLAFLAWAAWDSSTQRHRILNLKNLTPDGATQPQFGQPGAGNPLPDWVNPTGTQLGKVRAGSLRMISDRALEHRDTEGDGYADVYGVVDVDYCQPPPNDHLCFTGDAFLLKFLYGGHEPTPENTWSVYSGTYPSLVINLNDDTCSDTVEGGVSSCLPTGSSALSPPVSGGFWLDWDGDGRSDLAFDDGGNIGVYLSTGTGFTGPLATGIPYANNFRVLDIDGDGLDDLVRVEANFVRIHTRNSDGAATSSLTQYPDLLASITDGFGLTFTPQFVSTAHSNYQHGAMVAGLSTARPRVVVSQATLPDGIGGTYTSTYTYKGAREDILRGTFMGFQERHALDSRTNLLSKLYFRQEFPRTGWLWKTEMLRDGTTLLSSSETSDSVEPLETIGHRQRYLPYVTGTVSETYEPENSGTLIVRRTVALSDYDFATGNVGTITTTLENQSGSDEWTSVAEIQYEPQAAGCLDLPKEIDLTLDRVAPDRAEISRKVTFTKDGAFCRHATRTVAPSSERYQVVTTYGYDNFGNVSSTTVSAREPVAGSSAYQAMPPREGSTYWGVYGVAPEWITNALDETTTVEYFASTGLLKRVADPNGLAADLEYDAFGRLTKMVRPDQTYTEWQYMDCASSAGCMSGTQHRATVVQSERSVTHTTISQHYTHLDRFDRPLATSVPLLNGNYQWSQATYDALGRVKKTSIPCLTTGAANSCAASWMEVLLYDLLGRPRQVQRPGQSGNLQTTIVYDGLTTSVTDPLGRMTRTTTDVTGNLRQSVDANDYFQSFEYDSAGSLVQVNEQAQPGRSSTLFSASYGYGIAAFQETSNDRALGARTLWHDGLGQLRRWTDAKGQNFEASYDPLSRPVMRRDGVTGSSTQETKTQWVWGQSSSQHNIVGSSALRSKRSTASMRRATCMTTSAVCRRRRSVCRAM